MESSTDELEKKIVITYAHVLLKGYKYKWSLNYDAMVEIVDSIFKVPFEELPLHINYYKPTWRTTEMENTFWKCLCMARLHYGI